ncbi:fumarylacetoacetate hydrolase family protein [Saccharopolyspora sp. NPDC002376]
MKIARIGSPGEERPALVLDEDHVAFLPTAWGDLTPAFWADNGLRRLSDLAASDDLDVSKRPRGVRVGAPVARPGQVVAIGLNYADHAAESNTPPPAEPIVFSKWAGSVCGPDDAIRLPPGAATADWEVELAVIIGSEARYLSDPAAASRCIAGWCLANDVSERTLQLERGGQWFKGKSAETFCPLGPWLVTPDELPDPRDGIALRTRLNGDVVQDGTTADMIFDIPFLIHHVSQFTVLEPGDVLLTGTPAGVGFGMSPQRFLKPGDELHLTASGLGEQRQRVEAAIV